MHSPSCASPSSTNSFEIESLDSLLNLIINPHGAEVQREICIRVLVALCDRSVMLCAMQSMNQLARDSEKRRTYGGLTASRDVIYV